MSQIKKRCDTHNILTAFAGDPISRIDPITMCNVPACMTQQAYGPFSADPYDVVPTCACLTQ